MLTLEKVSRELLKESKNRIVRFCIFETDEGFDIFLEDNTYIYVEKSNPDKESLNIIYELWGRQCTPLGKALW